MANFFYLNYADIWKKIILLSNGLCYNLLVIVVFLYLYNEVQELETMDRNISIAELQILTGVAVSKFSSINKGEYISIEVFVKICVALKCDVGDVIEVKSD